MRSSNSEELTRLQTYVDRFNARDFDGIRTMLADEVRFDLVARLQGGRSAFETYFTRYAEMSTWRLSIGWVDGRLAAVVTNPADPSGGRPSPIVIDWTGEKITRLRDFYHAPYALEGAEYASGVMSRFPPKLDPSRGRALIQSLFGDPLLRWALHPVAGIKSLNQFGSDLHPPAVITDERTSQSPYVVRPERRKNVVGLLLDCVERQRSEALNGFKAFGQCLNVKACSGLPAIRTSAIKTAF